jgi:hypothetical protein
MSEPLRVKGRATPKGTLNFTAAFYPTLNVADPDEEVDEEDAAQEVAGKLSMDGSRKSMENGVRKSLDKDPVQAANEKQKGLGRIDKSLATNS